MVRFRRPVSGFCCFPLFAKPEAEQRQGKDGRF